MVLICVGVFAQVHFVNQIRLEKTQINSYESCTQEAKGTYKQWILSETEGLLKCI